MIGASEDRFFEAFRRASELASGASDVERLKAEKELLEAIRQIVREEIAHAGGAAAAAAGQPPVVVPDPGMDRRVLDI
jgi:hypothetical protein